MTAASDIELLIPLDALDILRQVNAYLRAALIRLQPERTHCSVIEPQDLWDLRNQNSAGRRCLRRLPPDAKTIAAFENEFFRIPRQSGKAPSDPPDLYGRLIARSRGLKLQRLAQPPPPRGPLPVRRRCKRSAISPSHSNDRND